MNAVTNPGNTISCVVAYNESTEREDGLIGTCTITLDCSQLSADALQHPSLESKGENTEVSEEDQRLLNFAGGLCALLNNEGCLPLKGNVVISETTGTRSIVFVVFWFVAEKAKLAAALFCAELQLRIV